ARHHGRDHRFRDVLGRHDIGRDAVSRQRLCRGGSDSGYGHARQVARGEPPLGQPIAHDVDGVLAGEHDPVIGGRVGEGGALRSALVRCAVRRAAASQRDAPRRADWWLRVGCAVSPAFADCYPALVRLRRAIEDRWGAVAAAQDAADRFPENPDAWMLLGEAFQMVFRQHDALVAYEQVLTLEERPDAALAAGDLYARAGRPADASARFARAYAA